MAQTAPPKPKQKPPKPPKKGGLAKAAAGPAPAAQAAQAELDPVLASITQAANDRATRAEAAIKGLTDSYAHDIAGIDYGTPYTTAEGQQASVDDALRQQLAGAGSDLSAGLSDRLKALAGSSGAPAVEGAGAGLAAQGSGSGLARLASGSASLGDLIAHGAAAEEYGAKQPGIAKLAGIQGVRQAEGNAQSEIASGTTSVESKLPDVIQQIKSDRLAAKNAKNEQQYRAAEMALARDKAIVSEQQGQERIGIEQQNANTAAARAAQTAFNENRNYGVALSRLGIENKRLQLEALKSEAKKQGGGFTPYEIHGLTKDAGQVIEQGKQNGYTRAQVLNNLAANGIPLSIAAPLLKRFGYAPVNLGSPAAGNGKSMFANLGSLFKQEGGGGPFAAAGNATETVAARTIVGLAHEYIGTPYVYGGESPKGFDCSGLAQYLYGKAGIRVPRTSEEQYAGGMPVPNNQLQPGDLLFFVGSDGTRSAPGHEGIYIGNGHFIEAPHTGASVRVSALAGYPGYVGARRYGKG